MMEKRYLFFLIKRWLAGKTTPQEQKKLDEYWDRALEDDTYLDALPATEREALRSEMYQNVWQTIRQQEKSSIPVVVKEERKRLFLHTSPVYWIAASVALFMLMGLGIYTYTDQCPMQTVVADFGKRREVRLPDHSVVILNGNSSVRYAKTWEKEEIREVWLEGEAYFSVRHTQNHQKFIVHTPDDLHIEVLGTKFNVVNRRGDTRIVLQEGKVKVTDGVQKYVMKPGEMVRYQVGQAKLIPVWVNPSPAVSWKDRIRVYQDEKLLTILQGLQDSHGIKVEFRNESLKDELFTGSIPTDSVEIIFKKIEKLYPVTVIKKGDTYILQ